MRITDVTNGIGIVSEGWLTCICTVIVSFVHIICCVR